MNEEVADELIRLCAQADPVSAGEEGVSVKEKMVYKIAESGYVRPKRNSALIR